MSDESEPSTTPPDRLCNTGVFTTGGDPHETTERASHCMPGWICCLPAASYSLRPMFLFGTHQRGIEHLERPLDHRGPRLQSLRRLPQAFGCLVARLGFVPHPNLREPAWSDCVRFNQLL